MGGLPGHPLARHVDDFLTGLENADKPRNIVRDYRGDLISFAAHYGAAQVPSPRRRSGHSSP